MLSSLFVSCQFSLTGNCRVFMKLSFAADVQSVLALALEGSLILAKLS